MTDARSPLGWVRADNRAIIWWGAEYPVHWDAGEGFAIYGDPSETDAAPYFKDEAALKTSIKNLITHRAAGDYDLMADDVANALWPLIRQARDLALNPTPIAAGAEALHRIGRHHGWWKALGLEDRDSYRTPADPIAQREFEALVAEILAAARVAQADDYKAATEALQQCWGALNFILAFYDPNQRHLDTNAWKQAEAGGRRAHAHARKVLDALKAQSEDEENPWRSQAEWSRLLDLRDTFIAGEGLWSLFMVSLEKREQLSRTD